MIAAAKELPTVSYVYVIGANDGPQKVGFSTNPAIRCRSFGVGRYKVHHAHEVYTRDARAIERYAHCLLYEHHFRGEWFNVSPWDARVAIVDAVLAILRGEKAPFVPMLAKRRVGAGRNSLLGVRLDDAERKALASAAEKRGLGVSPLVRMVLLAWLRAEGFLED
jgi:hypothetical protein